MRSSLSSQQLQQLARLGAPARIQELEAEIAAIRQAFPQAGGDGGHVPIPFKRARGRKRRKMSAAARKKISDAQKKRWAAQRKARAKR